jgi:lipoic acid synthetase
MPRVIPLTPGGPRLPKPEWLKVRAPGSPSYLRLKGLMRDLQLHTVCEEAQCPNIGECWNHGTATFMILGDVCTRSCSYCAVAHGRPAAVDTAEPERVAHAIHTLDLNYVVITSVDRDDLADGGAAIFAATIRETRARLPHCYPRTLELLARSRQYAPAIPTKTGLMVGLGEEREELIDTLQDLRGVDCQILTIGQYLRPTAAHAPMVRYYHPDEFRELKAIALDLGFVHVESGPLVRSSYHAHETADAYDRAAQG